MGSKTKKNSNVNREAYFDKKKMNAHLRQPITRAESINKFVEKDDLNRLGAKVEALFHMLAGTWLYLKETNNISLEAIQDKVVDFSVIHKTFTEVMKVQQSEMITNKADTMDDNKILEGCRAAGIPDDVTSVIFGIKEKVPEKKEDEVTAKVDEQFPKNAKKETNRIKEEKVACEKQAGIVHDVVEKA